MMTLKIKLIIIFVILLAIGAIVNLIRKKSLELKYALTWMILSLGLLIIVLIPGLLEAMASALGIYNVMNMVFFVGFIFAIILIFGLTMSMSRNSDRVRKMAQYIALNEYKIRNMQRDGHNGNDTGNSGDKNAL
jgi:hypothetical protein